MSCTYCRPIEPLDYAPIRCSHCHGIIPPLVTGLKDQPDPCITIACANCGEDELGWRCPQCFFCAVCCDCHLDDMHGDDPDMMITTIAAKDLQKLAATLENLAENLDSQPLDPHNYIVLRNALIQAGGTIRFLADAISSEAKTARRVACIDELGTVLRLVAQDMGVEDAPYYGALVSALKHLDDNDSLE